MSVIGMNIRGGGFSNENVAHWIITELKPRSVIVINEAKLAAMLVGQVERVIFRMKDTTGIKDDDSAYTKHSPITFVDALHTLAPAGCWLYLGNEFGSDNLPQQDAWTYEAVQRCVHHKRKPAVHAQYTHHYLQGRAGWASQRRSILAAAAAGGGVIPHIYYYPTIEAEVMRRPRHGFMVLQELRDEFGDDLPIIVSEFGYAHMDNPRDGYLNHLSQDRYADDTEKAANLCRMFNADLCPYGFFEHGTEWESFNLLFAEQYKRRIAAYNRGIQMEQIDYGIRTQGVVELVNAKGLNIRPQPNTSLPAVGMLEGGEVISYFSTPRDGWYKIEWKGVERYVSAQYIRFRDVIDPHPPVPLPLPEFDIEDRVPRHKLAAWWRQIADLVEHGVISPG